MLIPLVDLKLQHRQIADELQQGFARLFENTAFILGEEVASFERAFAQFSGVKHCVGVANGTDAIEMMLRAVGVANGDEVIVPANSFVATAFAVMRAGAVPRFVDSDPETHLIDAQAVALQINHRTKAILAVHLYGQMAPMEDLKALADRTGVLLLEDAAQAHGARRHNQGLASVGLAAATSFYPGKNLGGYGDGGAVLTNSDDLAAAVRALRNYGSEIKYHHPRVGFNSRLDAIQAVVLSAKLKHLATWNEARRQAARRYDDLISGARCCYVAGHTSRKRARLALVRHTRATSRRGIAQIKRGWHQCRAALSPADTSAWCVPTSGPSARRLPSCGGRG